MICAIIFGDELLHRCFFVLPDRGGNEYNVSTVYKYGTGGSPQRLLPLTLHSIFVLL